MSKLLILLGILAGCALTACGPANKFCSSNYERLNGFCDTIVGYELAQDVERNKQGLNDLKEKLDILYLSLIGNINNSNLFSNMLANQVMYLTNNQQQIENLIQNNTSSISNVLYQLSYLNSGVYSTVSLINELQSQIWSQQIQIAELIAYNENNKVVETIDFCGDKPNKFDEIGLRLSSGELVVFFRDSPGQEKYFLTVLTPGNYSTTDNTGCNFSVGFDGTVSW